MLLGCLKVISYPSHDQQPTSIAVMPVYVLATGQSSTSSLYQQFQPPAFQFSGLHAWCRRHLQDCWHAMTRATRHAYTLSVLLEGDCVMRR